jgi:hypothetical protein
VAPDAPYLRDHPVSGVPALRENTRVFQLLGNRTGTAIPGAAVEGNTTMDRKHEKYERLIEFCKALQPRPTAVAHPCDQTSLEGAVVHHLESCRISNL